MRLANKYERLIEKDDRAFYKKFGKKKKKKAKPSTKTSTKKKPSKKLKNITLLTMNMLLSNYHLM